VSQSEPLSVVMAAGPLPVDEVMRIGRGAAVALKEVHGELWPSAIAVSEETIGIVPPGLTDRTRYGQYAAPERILGKPATPASDVFSLGAILFHALAGRPAFRGDSAAAVMLAICTDKPLPLPDHVPKELAAVIERCLRRAPQERYATPALLGQALEGAVNREQWRGRRILLADDDAPIRDLYARIAAGIGVDADIVSSGRDAIEALKTCKYDLAMLDLNMPRLSGWEVLDYLRDRYDKRPAHLFILTGFRDQAVSEADKGLVERILYKPMPAAELKALITDCLSKRV
jgi:CheY-like chemotaxis protein